MLGNLFPLRAFLGLEVVILLSREIVQFAAEFAETVPPVVGEAPSSWPVSASPPSTEAPALAIPPVGCKFSSRSVVHPTKHIDAVASASGVLNAGFIEERQRPRRVVARTCPEAPHAAWSLHRPATIRSRSRSWPTRSRSVVGGNEVADVNTNATTGGWTFGDGGPSPHDQLERT